MAVAGDQNIQTLQEYMRGLKSTGAPCSHLIAILHKTQELYGYLPREAMDEIALTMDIPRAHIWGVATFYHYFNLTRPGRHSIALCMGTACFVKGAADILEAIKNKLNIDFGETTGDGLFTLQQARCLGACGLAPVMMINDKIYGSLTPEKAVAILDDYASREKKGVLHTGNV
ncbi:MAG: NADH-quinone oxidoreductase subunit NuoE [Candidatus Omnitrophica bacterium]|nr:NADH-quinone oxidoreductase subunit NuoE [Candidatus Omnitrophota bacterium]